MKHWFKLQYILYAALIFILLLIGVMISFHKFQYVNAETSDEKIEIDIPYDDCKNYIKNESNNNTDIFLENDKYANTDDISQKIDNDIFGSFINLKATKNENNLNLSIPSYETCEWECYPMDMDCYTHYDSNGQPDQFQLVVHTSVGDAIGVAECNSPGLCAPGQYDIIGSRGEWSLPGDSHGKCTILYQYTRDGYYYWTATNTITRFSPNYQLWVGWFNAPAYGDCVLEKSTTCSWSESNINYSYGGNNQDCVHYDIYTDAQCSQYTGKYINLNQWDGKYSLGYSPKLQCGTYYIQESKSYHGNNYLWNPDIAQVVIEPDTTTHVIFNKTLDYKTYDRPLYSDALISLVKSDFDTKEAGLTLGSVPSFEGSIYEFDYSQDFKEYVPGLSVSDFNIQKKWFIKTDLNGICTVSNKYANNKINGDDYFYDEYGNIVCPLGTYIVHEVEAPNGYLLSETYYIITLKPDSENPDIVIQSVQNLNNGQYLEHIIEQNSGDLSVQIYENVIRGDYKFEKSNDAMNELSGIPFKFTSISTGEWHIYVTDENGCIDTSSINNSHCSFTNCNDLLYDQELNQILDESKLNPKCGCWFSLDKKNGNVSLPRDDCGCFPYDTYTIEELEVEKNSSYYPFGKKTFTVSKDDYSIRGGTWINSEKEKFLVSKAFNENKKQELPISSYQLVGDKIFYKGLIEGREYNLKAWLVDKQNNELIEFLNEEKSDKSTDGDTEISNKISLYDNQEENDEDTNQDKYYLVKSFKADSDQSNFEISAHIDTTNLAGKDLVWFCELYDTDMNNVLMTHKDINNLKETLWVDNKPDVPVIPPLTDNPQTYDNYLFIFIVILSLSIIFTILLLLRKLALNINIKNKYPGVDILSYKTYERLFGTLNKKHV